METIVKFIQEVDALIKKNDALEFRIKELEAKAADNRKKLTANDAETIRGLSRGGMKLKEIADIFDVKPTTVYRIICGVYH